MLQEHQSPFEASVVEQLRRQKYSVVGKTNLDEYGMGSHSTNSFFGPVRNEFPFDRYSVGGSSGGSAVAVASGKCHVSLGTDTGGSVRLPAAYTGIVGFKPSYGIISRWGVVPYANSLDTVGILGISAASASEVFDHAIALDYRDPTRTSGLLNRLLLSRKKAVENQPIKLADLKKLKIGVPSEYNITELEPGIRAAWTDSLLLLQKLGCTVVPISLPNTRHALSAYYVLAAAEAASNLSKYDGVKYGTRSDSSDGVGNVLFSKTRGGGFGDEVKRRILLGSYTLSSEAIDNYFIKAQKVRRLVQRDFDKTFSLQNPLRSPEQFDLSDLNESVQLNNKRGPHQVDFIVSPTAPTTPPTLDDVSRQTPVDTYMNDVFTVPASLAGLPAISIPFQIPISHQRKDAPGFTGIQFIGQYADDFRLLGVAKAVEKYQRENEVGVSLMPNKKVSNPIIRRIRSDVTSSRIDINAKSSIARSRTVNIREIKPLRIRTQKKGLAVLIGEGGKAILKEPEFMITKVRPSHYGGFSRIQKYESPGIQIHKYESGIRIHKYESQGIRIHKYMSQGIDVGHDLLLKITSSTKSRGYRARRIRAQKQKMSEGLRREQRMQAQSLFVSPAPTVDEFHNHSEEMKGRDMPSPVLKEVHIRKIRFGNLRVRRRKADQEFNLDLANAFERWRHNVSRLERKP
jgi:aspartyl-tRNA(Asn)/glutamyl-tRNA(Gln) amidotransferase subunit A